MTIEQATFGNGCFWCTEAIFQSIKGVIKVEPGYMGGTTPNPTYMEVCNGDTGHAEVARIQYNADEVSFETLLLVFFKTHNPTKVNSRINGRGTQYRSVIFHDNANQKLKAAAMIARLGAENVLGHPILTEVSPATEFYFAESYHQNYFRNNHSKPYCVLVIKPKLNKFALELEGLLKPVEPNFQEVPLHVRPLLSKEVLQTMGILKHQGEAIYVRENWQN